MLSSVREMMPASSRLTVILWSTSFLVPAQGAGAEERILQEAVEGRQSAGFSVGLHCDWNRQDSRTSTMLDNGDQELKVQISRDDCVLTISAEGEIEFNRDETDLSSVSRNGYFEVEERDGRDRRRLVVEANGDGSLNREWYLDGTRRPYDEAAQRWFADLVPVLFRRGGIQAEVRAARILAHEGVDGLLQEISLIPGDYVARQYYAVLLAQSDSNARQLRGYIRQAAGDLDSDYELAELLIGVAQDHPGPHSVRGMVQEALPSFGSDFQKRRVLDAVMNRPDIDPELTNAMLESATEIGSDFELAELLLGMLDRRPLEEVLTPEFFAVLGGIGSDFQHRRVLEGILERGAPDLAMVDLVLESAAGISSDFEKAELLIRVGEIYPLHESLPESYRRRTGALASDNQRGRVLSTLLQAEPLSTASLGHL